MNAITVRQVLRIMTEHNISWSEAVRVARAVVRIEHVKAEHLAVQS